MYELTCSICNEIHKILCDFCEEKDAVCSVDEFIQKYYFCEDCREKMVRALGDRNA